MAGKAKNAGDPVLAVAAEAAELLAGHSDLLGFRMRIEGIVLTKDEDGKPALGAVDLGMFSAQPGRSKSGKVNCFAGGKVIDPTDTGSVAGVKWQVGINITAVKSEQWGK